MCVLHTSNFLLLEEVNFVGMKFFFFFVTNFGEKPDRFYTMSKNKSIVNINTYIKNIC